MCKTVSGRVVRHNARTLIKLELIFCRIHNIQRRREIEFSASKISRVRDHILYKCTQSIRDYVARQRNILRMFLANISVIFSMQYFSNARKVISSTYIAILLGVFSCENVHVENKFHSAKIFPDWGVR